MTASQVQPQLQLGLRGSPVFGGIVRLTRHSSNIGVSVNTDYPLLDLQQPLLQNSDSTAAADDGGPPEAGQAADDAVTREPEVDPSEAAEAAPQAAGVAFGLLPLLVTGCVLALLGGCHSSCETLIYTVLTDLVVAAGDEQNDGGHGEGCMTQDSHASGSSCCGSSTICGAGAARDVPRHQKQPTSGSSTSKQHCSNAAVAGEPHECAQSSSCHATAEGAAESSDSTEVVMVLYVLFWVVGFTVGAAVAGLPGGSVVGQQLTGCVMGLVLASAAYWAWRTAAAAFSRL
jgi:hypothetical protein